MATATKNASDTKRSTSGINHKECRVVVINSDYVAFDCVINGLVKIIPNMTLEAAKQHAKCVHESGKSDVWSGPLEICELYVYQLINEGMLAEVQV